jgi:hypothetical protein
MTIALFLVFALFVLATAEGPIREVLSTNLIGFGILSLGIAGLQSEVRRVRREAAEDRKAALQERQARVGAELKRRSEIIASIDRQDRKTGNATPHVGATAPSCIRNADSLSESAPLQPLSRSPQLRSASWERRLELLASSANISAWRLAEEEPSTARKVKTKRRVRRSALME